MMDNGKIFKKSQGRDSFMPAFNGYITALFGMDSWQNHARKAHMDGWMDGWDKEDGT